MAEPKINLVRLGDNIKHARRLTGLDYAPAAEKACISVQTLFKLEEARTPNPTLQTLVNIAGGFGVCLEQLVQGVDS